jgi:hypothetical protein
LNAKAQLLRLHEHSDTFMHRNATDIDWRAAHRSITIQNMPASGRLPPADHRVRTHPRKLQARRGTAATPPRFAPRAENAIVFDAGLTASPRTRFIAPAVPLDETSSTTI